MIMIHRLLVSLQANIMYFKTVFLKNTPMLFPATRVDINIKCVNSGVVTVVHVCSGDALCSKEVFACILCMGNSRWQRLCFYFHILPNVSLIASRKSSVLRYWSGLTFLIP